MPSNTPLIVKIYADGDSTVVKTYMWNVLLRDTNIVEGTAHFEPQMIFRSTYDSIPTLSGRQVEGSQDVTDGVGRGVIMVKMTDCAGHAFERAYVSSALFDESTTVAYFDGDADDPKPDRRRNSTASDGL